MNRKHLSNPWVYVKLQHACDVDSDIEEEYYGNYSFIIIEDGSKKIKNNVKKTELQKEEFIAET